MNFCPRCGRPVTVTLTRRGTPRVHAHKCPHGAPCRRDDPSCDACSAGRVFAVAVRLPSGPILDQGPAASSAGHALAAGIAIQAAVRRAGGLFPEPETLYEPDPFAGKRRG